MKCLIFDLDKCIADPYSGPLGERGEIVTDVLEVLQNNEVSEEMRKVISKEIYRYGIDNIIHWHNFQHFADMIKAVYRPLIVPPGMVVYPDFEFVKELNIKKVLVTTGMQIHQQSKIDTLGLAPFFTETIINSPDNTLERRTKKNVLVRLMNKFNLLPHEVTVIGDRADDELIAGKELGMVTVQTLRPGVVKAEGFDYYIESFAELPQIIQNL